MILPNHFADYSQPAVQAAASPTTVPAAASQPANGAKPKGKTAGPLNSKKKRSADAKSLNAPYIKLTPILTDDDKDVDMNVNVEVTPTHNMKSNDLQDAVLVCNATMMPDGR